MSRVYTIEFAVKAETDFLAMERLKSFGISKADEATFSDLDRQADLFIIKASADKSELTDECYKNILSVNDIFILSDELSARRAKEVIDLCNIVERQIKKLLICVIPDIVEVIDDIIIKHQNHGSKLKPTNQIEWCRKINDFSFGELPKVLEQDISEIAKKKLLSGEGILSMVASAKDFETFKADISDILKPKTVWNSINSILEKPVEYSFFSGALLDLCRARNDAAHLKTITSDRLLFVKRDQKRIMAYISDIRSDYRENLKINMQNIFKSIKSMTDIFMKFDPNIMSELNKKISGMFNPINEMVQQFGLSFETPELLERIKQDSIFREKLQERLAASLSDIKNTGEYNKSLKKLSTIGFEKYISSASSEADDLISLVNSLYQNNKIDIPFFEPMDRNIYNEKADVLGEGA